MKKSKNIIELEEKAYQLKRKLKPMLAEKEDKDSIRAGRRVEHIPRTKFNEKDTNGLTKCIEAWYYVNGGFAMRVNTQGQYDEKRKMWRKSGATPGVSDIIGIIDGKVQFVEVKFGSDTQSENQKKFQRHIEKSGGIYFIARNFDSFVNFVTLLRIV